MATDCFISKGRDEKQPCTSVDKTKRIAQMNKVKPIAAYYPRLASSGTHPEQVSIRQLLSKASILHPGSHIEHESTISGRIMSIRWAGSKLAFIDLEEDGVVAQAVCNIGSLDQALGTSLLDYEALKYVARRGDWYSVSGYPHKTSRGQPGLLATKPPRLDAPSLHQLPQVLVDPETSSRKPQLRMLTNPDATSTLRLRSRLEHAMSTFLFDRGFHKVTTPLLSAGAGGAVARPFETFATEFRDSKLNLRIAPELWLKRLVIGGLGRVYEIGPAFRNEGVDATHNPEFSICEFYMPYADLEDLMNMTQLMLFELRKSLELHAETIGVDKDRIASNATNLVGAETSKFARLAFLPTLKKQMGCKLPDLQSPTATADLLQQISQDKTITLPAKPTLPRLLDALSSRFIEPLCSEPTFIIEHPSIMSPLSKSFECPHSGQMVAARAELFIAGREYANMYEEENSPEKQREKFLQQLEYRRIDGESDGRSDIDESYIEALEYGLPPTGGWGLGIDRLVMLFSGQQRIGDVLPFGTLRNVVGISAKT